MPAIARSRSLSPSLIPNGPHRYLPYHRINTSYTFGERSPQANAPCDRLRQLNISSRTPSTQQRSLGCGPLHLAPRPQYHRRAISLSSAPAQAQHYVVFPPPHRAQISHVAPPHRAPPVPTLRRPNTGPRGPSGPRGQYLATLNRPSPIRIPSPPMIPIREVPTPRERDPKLLLVTPDIAAYLKQGGAVSVRGADGKSWRIKAPMAHRVMMQ